MEKDLSGLLKDCMIPEDRIDSIIRSFEPGPESTDSPASLLLEVLRYLCMNYRTFSTDIGLLDDYLSQHLGSLSSCEKAQYFHLNGFHLWKSGHNLYRVLHRLNAATELLDKTDTHESRGYQGKVYDTYARVLQSHGLYKDAVYEYNNALIYKEDYDDQDSLALTYGNIGRLYMEIGEYDKAHHFLKKDADFISTLADDEARQNLLAKLFLGLGICSMHLGEHEEAEQYFDRCREINMQLDNQFGTLLTLFNYASLRIMQKRADDAIAMITEAEHVIDTINPKYKLEFENWVLKIKADYYAMTGKYEPAYASYKKAVNRYTMASGTIHLIDRAMFFLALARTCLELGYTEEAARYYRQTLELLDITDAERHRRDVEAELQERLPESWMLHNSGRFIGHRHVERLLHDAGHTGFRGERKKVIVLFSDIRDFTSLSEDFKPEQLIIFLNAYLTSMTRCIEYFGGYIDKFIGDAVMGIFNLFEGETGISGVAENALLSAMLMQEEVARFNRSLPADIRGFRTGIGLHYGEVVSGLIGSPQKRSYTVIGDTVNTASRLESLTKELDQNVLISKEMKDLLPAALSLSITSSGSHAVKGRTKKIRVYSVTSSD